MDYWPIAVACGAVGVAMIWVIGRRRYALARNLSHFASTGDCKMVILVRNDLNMGKGKAAAQCCHAVLETYKQAIKSYPKLVDTWEECGQPKITLKVESDVELGELVGKARKAGLPAQAIRDAGRTQLVAGTRTVAAIGPGI